MGNSMGISMEMLDRRLAVPNPANFRFAVFCCAYKMDLGCTPENALALFVYPAMAMRYGAWMWPTTFQVVDLDNPTGARP